MVLTEDNNKGQAECKEKPKRCDIILYAVLGVFLLVQITMLVLMPFGDSKIKGFMVFLTLTITYLWWRFVIRVRSPEYCLSRIKRLKEQGRYYLSNSLSNPRMAAKDRFILEKRCFATAVVLLSLLLYVVTFNALNAKYRSSLPLITTHSIIGFMVLLLMLGLVIYIKLRWEEKLFCQKKIVTTGLIYQNILLAFMLLVS